MKAFTGFTFILAALLVFAIFGSSKNEKGNEEIYGHFSRTDGNGIPQVVEPVKLKKSYDFAGEELPMKNFDVRERLDRELTVNTYWHSSTVLNIKNANKYFPVIEPILAENNVPDDFKYLAVAESSLRNATSPAGAKGIWQFLKSTGEFYGLEINKEVDERYHLEKATVAFCKYITLLKNKFGSWTAAAAGYNMGETKLRNSIKDQRSSSYYDLNLNEETARYVFRLVAMKEIITDPRAFGFYLEEEDLYPPLGKFINLQVSESVENLGDFAEKNDISYRMLKVYNPWLRSSKLTNPNRKTYLVRIPKKKFQQTK